MEEPIAHVPVWERVGILVSDSCPVVTEEPVIVVVEVPTVKVPPILTVVEEEPILRVVWSVSISPPFAIRSPWEVILPEQLTEPVEFVMVHPV